MKLLSIIVVYFIILFASCNTPGKQNNDNIIFDTVVIYDTIKIYDSVVNYIKPNYNTEEKLLQNLVYKSKERFYEVVKKNEIDSNFSRTFYEGKITPESLVFAMLYDDDKFNEAVVLFFLKYYHAILMRKCKFSMINNGINYSKNNIYLALLFYQYSKITETTGQQYSDDIFFWLLSHPKHLKNKDIKKEFDKIDRNPIVIEMVNAIKNSNGKNNYTIIQKEILMSRRP